MPPKGRPSNLKSRLLKVSSNEGLSTAELRKKYQLVKTQNIALDKEIAYLRSQGISEDLQPQIEALHEYNEVKDTVQRIVGCLADFENSTLKELHEKYNLPLD